MIKHEIKYSSEERRSGINLSKHTKTLHRFRLYTPKLLVLLLLLLLQFVIGLHCNTLNGIDIHVVNKTLVQSDNQACVPRNLRATS